MVGVWWSALRGTGGGAHGRRGGAIQGYRGMLVYRGEQVIACCSEINQHLDQ